jgi:hypothetical protein
MQRQQTASSSSRQQAMQSDSAVLLATAVSWDSRWGLGAWRWCGVRQKHVPQRRLSSRGARQRAPLLLLPGPAEKC